MYVSLIFCSAANEDWQLKGQKDVPNPQLVNFPKKDHFPEWFY
jgi:hypothetical protein